MMTEEEHDTEITPTAQAPQQAQAWSLDETDEDQVSQNETPEQPTRHGLIVSVGLVTLVVGIIGSVILLAATFFTGTPSKTSKPSAIPTAAALPAPPPPAAPRSPTSKINGC